MSERRKGNWFFALLRALIGCALLAAAVGAGIYFWLDHKANKRWAEVEAMLTREGETLNYVDLLPMRMPEAENYAAMEELRDIATVVDGDDQKGEPAEKRKALAALDHRLAELRYERRGRVFNQPTPWDQVAQSLLSRGYLATAPAPGQEAAGIRAAIEAKSPLLPAMATRAASFSRAQFLPPLRERPLPAHLLDTKCPHYAFTRGLTETLSWHALAALESGDAKAALADAEILLLHGLAFREEPSLISQFIVLKLDNAAVNIIWNVLAARPAGLHEADLARVQRLLENGDLEKGLLQAFRADMVIAFSSLEALSTDVEGRKTLMESFAPGSIFDRFSGLWPASLMVWNKVALGEIYMARIIQPLKSDGLGGLWRQRDQIDLAVGLAGDKPLHLDLLFPRVWLSLHDLIIEKTASIEVSRRQAMLACALERYRLKNGDDAASLGVLVPQWISGIPMDPLAADDQAPLRYQRTPEGRYKLWSVGGNGLDDGGEIIGNYPEQESLTESTGTIKFNIKCQGDWIWTYEALMKTPSNNLPDLPKR